MKRTFICFGHLLHGFELLYVKHSVINLKTIHYKNAVNIKIK